MSLFKNTTHQGNAVEALAAEYLKKQGLKYLTSQFRSRFGGAEASITSSKQHKIVTTAEYYLQQHGNAPCRFDVILMDGIDIKNITWVKDAFQA
jgi:putative endonuclease